MKAPVGIMAILLLAASCSTTRALQEGENRLARNNVRVSDKSIRASYILPYVKQQANSYVFFGWSPGLYIYNWGANSESGFAKFCRKIGQKPVVFNPELVPSSEINIRNHMENFGYYYADVSSKISIKNRLATVDYYVVPGMQYEISQVKYELPSDSTFCRIFLADTVSNLSGPGSKLAESNVEREFERSRAYLRNNGYYDIEKSDYSFVADTMNLNGKALVEYKILRDSITRYKFGDIRLKINGDTPFRKGCFEQMLGFHKGEFFDDSKVSKTYSRLSSIPAVSGTVIRTKSNGKDEVECDVTVNPAKIRGFKFDFEASFTSSGLLGFSPKLSYFNKNIFHSAEILELNFSGNFQLKPSTGAKSNEFGVAAKIKTPHNFLSKSGNSSYVTFGEYSASFNRQMRPEYTRNIISASYGYSGRFGEKTLFQINPVQINYVLLQNISDSFRQTLDKNPLMRYSYTNHFDLGLGTAFVYRTDHSLVPQNSYKVASLDLQTAGNLISLFNKFLPADKDSRKVFLGVPYSQYLRGEIKLCRNWRFGPENGQAFALRLVSGAIYAYGNSESAPFEKKLYVGGSDSMRGWQARALGPGSAKLDQSFQIPSQTGDFKLEFDSEYRFKMFWKIEGALFAEVGNVWEYNNMQQFWKSLAGDWGLGLRLNLNFIVIRFDYGFRVYDPAATFDGKLWLGPKEWFTRGAGAFHFGVGYPF